VAASRVGWSLHRDPDLITEIWSTAALIEAVVAALLDDPDNLRRALEALRPASNEGSA